MNATLLCPGPSLANYAGEGRGIVVGVNRAVTLHQCDMWAATDHPLIRSVTPLGDPALFTITASRDSLERRGIPWPRLVVTHDDIAGQTVTNGRHPWTRYTATAALQYLIWSGATHIDVWGADWSGTQDWDGTDAGQVRTADRWAAEREIWQGVIDRNDTEVVRH